MTQSSTQIKLREYGELISKYKGEPRPKDFEKAISFYISLENNKLQASDAKDMIQDCVIHLLKLRTHDVDLGLICNRLKQIFYSSKRKQCVRDKYIKGPVDDGIYRPDKIFGIPNHRFVETAIDANKISDRDADMLLSAANYSGYGERFLSKKYGKGYGKIKEEKERIRKEFGIY